MFSDLSVILFRRKFASIVVWNTFVLTVLILKRIYRGFDVFFRWFAHKIEITLISGTQSIFIKFKCFFRQRINFFAKLVV